MSDRPTWEYKRFRLKPINDLRISKQAQIVGITAYKLDIYLYIVERADIVILNTRRILLIEDKDDLTAAVKECQIIGHCRSMDLQKFYTAIEDLTDGSLRDQIRRGEEVEKKVPTTDSERTTKYGIETVGGEVITSRIQSIANGLALKKYAAAFSTLTPLQQASVWRKASKGFKPEDLDAAEQREKERSNNHAEET